MDRKEIGGRAVGVDFGTTKSVLAVLREGRPYVVPDVYGHESTPSLVLVAPDGSLQVGWDALQHPMRYESRHLTIGSVKRLMGKTGETD